MVWRFQANFFASMSYHEPGMRKQHALNWIKPSSRWLLWGFWTLNASFNHLFGVFRASIFSPTTSWSSRTFISGLHMLMVLNISIKRCLWITIWVIILSFLQNLEARAWMHLAQYLSISMGAKSHRTLCGANSFHATCAIQGLQHKRSPYSPACFNEISSLIGKFLLFQSSSAIRISQDKARAHKCFCFYVADSYPGVEKWG